MRRRRWKNRVTSSGHRFSREQIRPKLANEPTTNARGGDFSARMLADLVRKGPTTAAVETEMTPRGPIIKVERVLVMDDAGARSTPDRSLPRPPWPRSSESRWVTSDFDVITRTSGPPSCYVTIRS